MKLPALYPLLLLLLLYHTSEAQPSQPSQMSLQERLIAQADYHCPAGAFVPEDSLRYFYSHGRGDFTGYYLRYSDDSMLQWQYSPSAAIYRNQIRTVDSFDSQNNIITSLSYIWDTVAQDYVRSVLSTSTYDTSHNQLSSIYQVWSSAAGAWTNVSYSQYAYDTSNTLTLIINQIWDSTANAWINSNKYILVDSATYTTVQTQLNWNTATHSWVNVQQMLFGFNSGLFTAQIIQNWSSAGNSWIDSFGIFYTYNPDNTPNTTTTEYWDTAAAAWIPASRIVYDFSQNYSYLATTQLYSNGNFITTTRDSTSLDGRYLRVADIIQSWDSVHMRWNNVSRTRNEYDYYYATTQTISDHWTNGSWQPDSTDMMSDYYYELVTPDGLPAIAPAGDIRLYPSPASTQLTIHLDWDQPQAATIDIYDESGRLWRQWQAPTGPTYDSSIPVSSLPAGIYYMEVRGSSTSLSRSFSIVR